MTSDGRKADAKHAASGGGTNLLAIIAGLMLPVFHMLVARVYGVAVYGLYALGLGVTDPMVRFCSFGTDKGLLRHIPSHRVANERELEARSLATAFWLTVLVGLALTVAVELFAEPLARLQEKREVVTALRYLAPSAPFAGLILVLIAATMAAKVLRFNLYVRGLAQPGLLALVALPVGYWAGPSLFNLCLSHLVATVATAVLAGWAAGRVFSHLPLRAALWRGPPHWELVRFSLPMGMSEFFNALLRRVDIILLSLYVDERALGIYAAAEMISRVVSNARYAFDPVVAPVLAEALHQQDHARLGYNLKLMTRWVALLTFPVVAFVSGFREELLGLYGPEYTAAGGVLVVLVGGYLVNGVTGLAGWVMPMSGRSQLVLINNLVAVGANIVLCLVLLPRYQLMGAAWAVGGAVLVVQLLFFVQTLYLERVHAFSWGFFKVALAGSAVLAGMVVLGPRLPGPVALRLVYGTLAMLAAYGLLLAVLGLGPEEKQVVREQLAKLQRRR